MPHKHQEPQEPPQPKPNRYDAAGEDRSDRSLPVAWVIVIVMGLLLINGFLFLQGFFTNLLAR